MIRPLLVLEPADAPAPVMALHVTEQVVDLPAELRVRVDLTSCWGLRPIPSPGIVSGFWAVWAVQAS
jgi:hypothetical protein